MSLNTTPRTWVTGEVVTAAEMNTEIRDALTGVQAAWTAYTPATTGITLGNGTIAGRSCRLGKTVKFQIQFTFGSTSAITGATTATLPFTALGNSWQVDAVVFDTSAGSFFAAFGVATTTAVVKIWVPGASAAAAMVNLGAATPMTWAVGDQFTVLGIYEAA